jgi:nicotinate-nucleotide--dimethylbenzimidazole phosphoribosyltransferase
MLLADTCARITPPSPAVAAEAQRLLDQKTKPRRSLGRLEELACRLAAARGTARPGVLAKALVVMGADHGVAAERVSAYPREVTTQMMLNFAAGGAAVCVLGRQAGAQIVVVDIGVAGELPPSPAIWSRRIAAGTASFTRGAAMTRTQAVAAIEVGITLAAELAADGVGLIGIGEMGIGNTTSASALVAGLTGAPPEAVTGRGTGVDDAGLARKLAVIQAGLARHRPDARDPIGVLAALGGFEIAGMCGVALGAAAARVPVLVDGFIAGTAALLATRIAPACAGYLIASHRSVEPGHRRVLDELDARPLLELDLRLGEGTGAALAMPLCDAALGILDEMATFGSAGVSDSGA